MLWEVAPPKVNVAERAEQLVLARMREDLLAPLQILESSLLSVVRHFPLFVFKAP